MNSYHKHQAVFLVGVPIFAGRMRSSCGNQGSSTLTNPAPALCHTTPCPSKSGMILRSTGLGASQNRIAQALGRSQSSVSQEQSRNPGIAGLLSVTSPFLGADSMRTPTDSSNKT